MGGCRLLVAGEGEGAGVFDAALPVESVEDELLDRLRHVGQILLRERLCVQRARGGAGSGREREAESFEISVRWTRIEMSLTREARAVHDRVGAT